MIEGVFRSRVEARLVEEPRGLEVRQAAVDSVRGALGYGLEQWQRYHRANNCSDLEEALLLGCQSVDPRR
jgi:hypothetical protein